MDNDLEISLAFLKAADIRKSKSDDYGSDISYFPYGGLSYAQMIHTKSSRLVNLADKERMGIEPNHESIKDNLIDLINYASFWYERLERNKHD